MKLKNWNLNYREFNVKQQQRKLKRKRGYHFEMKEINATFTTKKPNLLRQEEQS